MDRMMADCRRFPSESNCQMTFIGPLDEVVEAAAQHAVTVHGQTDYFKAAGPKFAGVLAGRPEVELLDGIG